MIKQLDQKAISKITTSVVIQSLQSFVKELIENSIDAQASQINLSFYLNGKEGFEIADNGVGISIQEWKKVAIKGGTSKMEKWDDILSITTLGFRGEALNAISKLSNLIINTKVEGEEMGWSYKFDSDQTQKPTLVARERGTTFKLTNLFINLPVRQIEFEKNYKSQYNQTINMITEYAIIHPEIEFRVWNQEAQKVKTQIFNSGQAATTEERIKQILGQKTFDQLKQIKVYVTEKCQIQGYVSSVIESGSSNMQKKSLWYCYINKRPINTPKELLQSMSSIYRQFNPNGRFVFVLEFILQQTSDIDFNVSVDKREVYFKNMDICFKTLEEFMRELLDVPLEKETKTLQNIKKSQFTQKQVPSQEFSDQSQIQSTALKQQFKRASSQKQSCFLDSLKNKTEINHQTSSQQSYKKQQNLLDEFQAPIKKQILLVQQDNEDIQFQNELAIDKSQSYQINQQQELINLKMEFESSRDNENQVSFQEYGYKIEEDVLKLPNNSGSFKKDEFAKLIVLGQYNKGFMVCYSEQTGQIYILDQHACDEKITYESIINKATIQQVKLINPVLVSLQGYEIEIAQNYVEQLRKFGFTFQVIENQLYLITVPQIGKFLIPTSSFQQVLQNLSEQSQHSYLQIIPGIKNQIASQACRSSIMIGEVLSIKQMQELSGKMSLLQAPWNCPHGRPTFIRVESNFQQLINSIKIERGFSQVI